MADIRFYRMLCNGKIKNFYIFSVLRNTKKKKIYQRANIGHFARYNPSGRIKARLLAPLIRKTVIKIYRKKPDKY